MVLDPAYLIDLAGGDRNVAREILDDFVRSDVEDRRRLVEAARARDAEGLHTAAHRIKGAARSVGADAYAALAQTVEDGAARGTIVPDDVERVDATGTALAEWVTQFQ